MKTILTILLAFMIMGGCRQKPTKPQFHVRVECFGEPSQADGTQWYSISFTNDNWDTVYPLKECIDNTMGYQPVIVVYQENIFNNKSKAVAYAKTLTSFNKCFKINSDQEKLYVIKTAYYEKHPPKKYPSDIPKPLKADCCTVTQVY